MSLPGMGLEVVLSGLNQRLEVYGEGMTTVSGSQTPLLGKLLRRINEISTLPHVVMKVTAVAGDSSAGAEDLSRVIKADPALSSRVLKCVNSAAYGLRHRITSLQHAISYMGFQQVCNLAIGAAVSALFENDKNLGAYHRIGLWRHMVSVAVTARMIAIRKSMQNFEDAFLAGLLHDLGLILEDQYLHEEFGELMRNFPESRSLCQIEQEKFGFDHTQLAEQVGAAWKLPEVVCHVMRHHHTLETGYDEPYGKILSCVELANVLCTLQGVSSIGIKRVQLSPRVLECLQLDSNDLRVMAEDMHAELKLHQELLDMAELVE